MAQEAVQERRLLPPLRFPRPRLRAPNASRQPSVEARDEPNFLALHSDPFQGSVSAVFGAVSLRTIMPFLGFDAC